MKKELIKKLEQALQKEKFSLEKELESFAKEDKNLKYNWDVKRPPKDKDMDMEEKADEVEEYNNLVSLEHSLETKLKEVKIALEKIKKGKYGVCEKCGKEIETKRLSVYPEGKFCMTCNK